MKGDFTPYFPVQFSGYIINLLVNPYFLITIIPGLIFTLIGIHTRVMKSIIVFLLLFALVSPLEAAAKENFTRVGITFLGTGFLSLSIERHLGNNSLRANIGVFEFHEICLAITANRYSYNGTVWPHVGIGLMSVLIFPEGRFGRIDLLNIPLGVDFGFSEYQTVGLEGNLNFFLGGRQPGGGKVTFKNRLLPLPSVYYKYKLQ